MCMAARKGRTVEQDEVIRNQAEYMAALEEEVAGLRKRVEELQRLLKGKAGAKDAKKPVIGED